MFLTRRSMDARRTQFELVSELTCELEPCFFLTSSQHGNASVWVMLVRNSLCVLTIQEKSVSTCACCHFPGGLTRFAPSCPQIWVDEQRKLVYFTGTKDSVLESHL